MKCRAIAYGAITVINAISTGSGAAIGVGLSTIAKVTINDSPGKIKVLIKNDPNEDKRLAQKAVEIILQKYGLGNKFGAMVEVDSNIPIARGLKSSSAAANAIILATLGALKKRLSDIKVVKLGVRAAIDAKVTITGAFDDACASYFGNLIITNNIKMTMKRRFEINKRYHVLIHIPKIKSYTIRLDIMKIKKIAPIIKLVYRQALKGDYWNAMSFNGYVYSIALGHDPNIAIEAISEGAIASGLSGKGPAIAAIVTQKSLDSVVNAWKKYPGEIIHTRINDTKAHNLG